MVRPHGVLDAGMGIVGVVHGDVAAGVARERRGNGVEAAGAVVGAGLQRVRELRRELERMRALALRLALEREMLLVLLLVMMVLLLVLVLVVAVGRRRTAGRRRRGSNGRHGRGRCVAGSRDGQRRRIVSRCLAVGVASLRVSLRVGEPLRIVHGGLAGQKGPRPRRGVSAGCEPVLRAGEGERRPRARLQKPSGSALIGLLLFLFLFFINFPCLFFHSFCGLPCF